MNETAFPWLDAVPLLLAAARTGSARAAAEATGISPATATRQLARLEEGLGVRLFDRSPAGLLPTVALERVLPWAEQIEAAARGMQREVAGLEVEAVGTVRLALVPSMSSWFVAPALPRLLARHPGLQLELVPAQAVLDLARREADLALRLVRPEAGDLVLRRLVSVPLAVVASPALLVRTAPTALSDLPWLGYDPALAHLPEEQWRRAVVPDARLVLRSTDLETMLRAAQAGVGAVVVSEAMAAVVGGLIRVPLPTPTPPAGAVWLVAHRALRPVPRVAAVWDWLVEEFARVEAEGRLSLG